MTIVVGTNAYVTEADYTAYADARNITYDPVTLDADIIKASDFIETYYNFKGEVVDEAQAMKLPTDEVTIANIKKAALKAVEMQQAGLLDLDLASAELGAVKREKKKLNGIEKEIEYADAQAQTFKRKTPEIDLLLRPYTIGGTSSGLVRV